MTINDDIMSSGENGANITRLSDIPGIGPKYKRVLTQYFGSEAVALKVILDSRVDLVAGVPEIGSRQAVNIVKGAFEQRFGTSSKSILKTSDVQDIFESIIEIIQSYANTTYAKDKLYLYFPLPPNKLDTIHERQQYFANAMKMAHALEDEDCQTLKENLKNIRGLLHRVKPKRLEGRVVLTTDEKIFDELVERGVDKWCPVYVLSEGERAIDYAQGYDLVFYISSSGFFDDSMDMLQNVELLGENWTIDQILPEQTVGFYTRNYHVIRAASALADLFPKLPDNEAMRQFSESIDVESLKRVGILMEKLNEDGSIAQGIDEELDRYAHAVNNFQTAIAETEAWTNEEIERRISESKVTLGGQQIISILQSADMEGAESNAMRSMLPAEIVEIFSTVTREAEDRLLEFLGLDLREADWITGIVSEEIALPVNMVSARINDLEDKIRSVYAELSFEFMSKLANELEDLREPVKQAVQTLLEFDLFLAVGLFAKDYGLHTPNVSLQYHGVGIKDATNLFLTRSRLKGKHGEVQPIDYSIGDTPFKPEGTDGENCAVLSGANSGGKTTTIQTLAQIVTMAQTGFPVPARESYIQVFEEVYFFYKSRGMVSAGAFETMLEQFAEIVTSNKPKLALFDEVEAMTEPGSAANVIAGLMEILQQDSNSATVICSHLASEIRESSVVDIRIDGIEARGLDKNLDLIVDRSPRFDYVARSTPELIVERLAKLAKGEEKRVYSKILENLNKARRDEI
ncbi:MAG: MutS-related protein [Promethearchaeia archaeon]